LGTVRREKRDVYTNVLARDTPVHKGFLGEQLKIALECHDTSKGGQRPESPNNWETCIFSRKIPWEGPERVKGITQNQLNPMQQAGKKNQGGEEKTRDGPGGGRHQENRKKKRLAVNVTVKSRC